MTLARSPSLSIPCASDILMDAPGRFKHRMQNKVAGRLSGDGWVAKGRVLEPKCESTPIVFLACPGLSAVALLRTVQYLASACGAAWAAWAALCKSGYPRLLKLERVGRERVVGCRVP